LTAFLNPGCWVSRWLRGAGILGLILMPRPAQAIDQQMLLDVQINGHSIGKVGEFTLRDGALMAQRSELRDLGLRATAALTPRGSVSLNTESDGLIALSTLRGVTWRVDQKTQTLYVTAADDRLLPAVLEVGERPIGHGATESGIGVMLNYDMVNTFAGGQNRASGSLDVRTFSPWGVASSGLLVYAGGSAGGSGRETVRLDSTYTFADTATLRRYSVGDFITGGLGWTRPVHLEGFQVRSDFSMRPDLVTFPLPSVSGSAAVPSTVDVLANGNFVLSHQIEPGPFEIPQLPVVTGAGTISMTVTNALGQQVTLNRPFYASSALLTPGLQTFSAQVGAVRRNWGAVSNDYGKLAATGTYRRGLTPTVTVEGSAEGAPGAIMAGGGVAVNVYNLGVLNLAVAGSTGSGRTGTQLTVGAQRIDRRLSLGGSVTMANRNFRDVAAVNGDPVPRQQLNGNVGLSLGRLGSVGIAYARIDLISAPSPTILYAAQAQHSHVLSASYSVQVHRMAIYASDFHDFTNSGSSGVMVGLTIPFGRRSSVTVSLDSNGGYGQVQAQESVVSVGDWGYQAYSSADNSAHEFARLLYKSPWALLSAGVDHTGGQTSVILESQGALSLVDGGLFPSNTVYDSFAIVDTSGLGHVRVLQENRDIGSTNSKGRLLVPDLRSFDINHIAIEPTDVPLDTTIALTARQVRPQDRSGVVVRFPVKISHGALLRLVDEVGVPMPVGSTVTLRTSGVTVPVGYDGEAYVQDLGLHNDIAVEGIDGLRCNVVFNYKPVPGDIPTIGPLTCQERQP